MGLPEYQPHRDREERISSALLAIRAIVPLPLYPAHKRELLSVCIWKITEADGKKKVRYWSEGAIWSDPKTLQHEHVVERKELVSRLLAGDDPEQVVNDAVACMVTPAEHSVLGKCGGSGWDRYAQASIRVYDSQNGVWKDDA